MVKCWIGETSSVLAIQDWMTLFCSAKRIPEHFVGKEPEGVPDVLPLGPSKMTLYQVIKQTLGQ